LNLIATHMTTQTYRLVYGATKVNDKSFQDLVDETFEEFKVFSTQATSSATEALVTKPCHLQTKRCPRHEQSRFKKEWIYDAAVYIYEKLLPPDVRRMVGAARAAPTCPQRLILAALRAR
jgi:hypothetical protein